MLRFVGALLLILLLLYLCLLHSRAEERRVRECEGFLLLVRHIRTQIACFRTPLPEAIASFENTALEAAGVLPAARKSGLSLALIHCRACLSLDGESWKTLTAFADGVGSGFFGEAIALCDYTTQELAGVLKRRQSEAPGRTRVGHSLVICGGLMLLLLLV